MELPIKILSLSSAEVLSPKSTWDMQQFKINILFYYFIIVSLEATRIKCQT